MRLAFLAILLCAGCVGVAAAGSYAVGQVIAAYMPDSIDQNRPDSGRKE